MSHSTAVSPREQATVAAPVTPVAVTSGFRADVQALRAVAVSVVVLYHLFPQWLPGGFVGVDVFFVISGFLITQHLVEEIRRTGRIGLTQFWARRIRRLLPAAFAVLAACVVLVLTLMPRVTWQTNLQEIGASAAYAQNWLLGIHAVDYLAAHNSATVVQHYWSLAAEEQFYLAWPLLLLVGVAARRLIPGLTARRAVLVVLVLVGAASFAISLWFTATSPSLAFFATPTRGWEFAAGGLLGLAGPRLWRGPEQAWRSAASWVGLLVIAAAAVLITGEEPFPGTVATVPVLGAVLVLAGGDPIRLGARRWANARVVQWLGAYSYSIYLWHWPLIIVAPWVMHEPAGPAARIAIIPITLVLAWVTKRYIEDPVRTGRRWRGRRWPAYTFAAAAMAVVLTSTGLISAQVQQTNDLRTATATARISANTPCYGAPAIRPENGCPDPFARPADLDPAFGAADIYDAARPCQQDLGPATLTLCTFGETENPTKTVVVVGNSHAVRLVPALETYGRQHGWKIILAAKTDCHGLTTQPVGDYRPASCLTWSTALQQHLLGMAELDAVVYASHVSAEHTLAGPDATPAEVAEASEQVVSTWTALRQRGIPVVVTEDVPGMRPTSDPECLAASSTSYDPCAVDRTGVVLPNLMTELAQQHPALATYVPLTQYFCDTTRCHGLIGGVIVYSDSHHITATMSRTLAPYLGSAVASALR